MIIVYLVSIVSVVAIAVGAYFTAKKYATAYLILLPLGGGLLAAKLIITRDLSVVPSAILILITGLVIGVLVIPALMFSEIATLEEDIEGLKSGVNEENA